MVINFVEKKVPPYIGVSLECSTGRYRIIKYKGKTTSGLIDKKGGIAILDDIDHVVVADGIEENIFDLAKLSLLELCVFINQSPRARFIVAIPKPCHNASRQRVVAG
jgi:hypothetical protein